MERAWTSRHPLPSTLTRRCWASSISSANFTLVQRLGHCRPGHHHLHRIGTAAHRDPDPHRSQLAYSTTYTATISGVKDANGNTMTGSYTWSFVTATGSSTYTQLPLLYQSNLQYLGGFPSSELLQFGFADLSYAGQGLAYDPANNSLFMAGFVHDDSILQISIPSSIVNSSNLDNLATDSDLSPFVLAEFSDSKQHLQCCQWGLADSMGGLHGRQWTVDWHGIRLLRYHWDHLRNSLRAQLAQSIIGAGRRNVRG